MGAKNKITGLRGGAGNSKRGGKKGPGIGETHRWGERAIKGGKGGT